MYFSALAADSDELGVYVFDIQEYTVTFELSTPPPDTPQRRQTTVEEPRYGVLSYILNSGQNTCINY